jgi:hypothetical protein
MITDKVKYFLMFAGYPRSGHTLVASILNAHPNVICSNQQFIMNMVSGDPEFGLAKINILSKIDSGTHRSQWNPNAYIEPSSKGDITVVGDKTGHRTIEHLISNPEDLEVFKKVVSWPIKWIHVVRNPYDNITTWTKKNLEARKGKSELSTEFNIAFNKYKALNDKISELKKTEDVLTINHERVIRFIDKTLDELCNFLDVEKHSDWRSRVIKGLWKEPRVTRSQISWNPPMRAKVATLFKHYPWLKGYDFGG